MSLQKTEAIILRSIKQGETSKILHLYTRALGKISVMAKGARSFKSRFGGNLEPINHVSVQLYLRENRDLQFLSQAEIIHSFALTRKSLEKTAAAAAVCELLSRFGDEGDPNPHLFLRSLDALQVIDASPGYPFHILQAFQIRLITLAGFHADFSKCLKCQKATTETVLFSIPDGGFFCANCRDARSEGFPLSHTALTVLGRFQKLQFSNLEDPGSPTMRAQVDAFLGAYFRYHVEGFHDLKALKFYGKINPS